MTPGRRPRRRKPAPVRARTRSCPPPRGTDVSFLSRRNLRLCVPSFPTLSGRPRETRLEDEVGGFSPVGPGRSACETWCYRRFRADSHARPGAAFFVLRSPDATPSSLKILAYRGG